MKWTGWTLWLLGLLSAFLLTSWGSSDNPNQASAKPAAQSDTASQSRQIIVISDLHMGEGKDATTGLWYSSEDFRWPQQFAQFLKYIDREGKGATDLIINGDLFDLWQSRNCDCMADRGKDFGCTEQETLERLKPVLKAHKSEMEALGKFASKEKGNRLIIIPGNHDAGLLFPAVREAMLKSIGPDARVSFCANGYWLSDDKLIYLEHGHQIGQEVNKWKQWPSPFLESNGKSFLQRPLGEQFVQDYYNRFEDQFPVIDNISERGEGIYYAWKAEGTARTLKHVGGLVKFGLFHVSWRQFGQGLGKEGAPPEWDIDAIRDQGPQFLAESLPSDHPFASLIRDPNNKEVQEELAKIFSQLTVEDINCICEERARLAADQDKRKIQRTVNRCRAKGSGGMGAGGELIETMGSAKMVLSEHLEHVVYPAVKESFKIFIYGHTHAAHGPRTLTLSGGDWSPSVVNSGAWQRVATSEEITAIRKRKHLSKEETLSGILLEDLPACYTYVCIKPYRKGENPEPELLYWVGEEDQKGMVAKKPLTPIQ